VTQVAGVKPAVAESDDAAKASSAADKPAAARAESAKPRARDGAKAHDS
jgi:hypothetical protein